VTYTPLTLKIKKEEGFEVLKVTSIFCDMTACHFLDRFPEGGDSWFLCKSWYISTKFHPVIPQATAVFMKKVIPRRSLS
jgi:hypothetical protein